VDSGIKLLKISVNQIEIGNKKTTSSEVVYIFEKISLES